MKIMSEIWAVAIWYSAYGYRDTHYEDKTFLRLLYFYNGIPIPVRQHI